VLVHVLVLDLRLASAQDADLPDAGVPADADFAGSLGPISRLSDLDAGIGPDAEVLPDLDEEE
jgi:hypothetical protein